DLVNQAIDSLNTQLDIYGDYIDEELEYLYLDAISELKSLGAFANVKTVNEICDGLVNVNYESVRKLSYTFEMEMEDALFKDGFEDAKVMEALQMQIVDEAIAIGFKGSVRQKIVNGESICTVYEPHTHEVYNVVGNCSDLRNTLQHLMEMTLE